jgi:hypothetical protein
MMAHVLQERAVKKQFHMVKPRRRFCLGSWGLECTMHQDHERAADGGRPGGRLVLQCIVLSRISRLQCSQSRCRIQDCNSAVERLSAFGRHGRSRARDANIKSLLNRETWRTMTGREEKRLGNGRSGNNYFSSFQPQRLQ